MAKKKEETTDKESQKATSMTTEKATTKKATTKKTTAKAKTDAKVTKIAKEQTEKEALADKLKFTAGQLETLHLTPMVNSGQLLLRYPQDLTHPEQAYRAVAEKKSN